ncbi:hypothetical protein [Streptomyces sp. NPDC026673]|uniref:hypothetical protein n=1 Tax=Streptomyces sp. NPDC026673 TaxID=3155724 RepID=UPI0033C39210
MDIVVDGDVLLGAVTTALLVPERETLRTALREVRSGESTAGAATHRGARGLRVQR